MIPSRGSLYLEASASACSKIRRTASLRAERTVGGALAANGDGDDPIIRIVSVRHPRPREAHQEPQIVSPCGICREMLNDFAPKAKTIVKSNGRIALVPVADLLPNKYRRQP